MIVVVISLDPLNAQETVIDIPTGDFGIVGASAYVAHDLLHEREYAWKGGKNFVSLHPDGTQMHVFRIER